MDGMTRLFAVGVMIAVLAACATNSGLHSTDQRNMTVGLVQKEIKIGMSGGEVAAVLGSPNIVTRDNAGQETWVYDKIATEASYVDSSGSVGGAAKGAGIAGDTLLLGTVGGKYGRSSGASATTQRTLTVLIRFDVNGSVDSFSYHSSTF